VKILISSRGHPPRGGPPSWGLGEGLTTFHLKKKPVAKCHKWPQTWADSLEQAMKWKMDMRFGTWDVRSVYRAGTLK
jgi:hypothetical protein